MRNRGDAYKYIAKCVFPFLCIISCISDYYIINTFILTEKETLIVKTKRNVSLIR